MADEWAQLSKAKRRKVGCLIVKDGQIISDGYNGTPVGYDNSCEYETRFGYETKPEVLHAESNAISKLARSNESGENSTLFLTHSPCLECSKLIYQSGITTVYYKHKYRSQDGIDFLEKCDGLTVYCVG